MRLRLSLLLVIASARCLSAQPSDAGANEHFEKHIRPVLVEHCVSCHGREKQKGGLRLDSRAGLLAGGDAGPVVVPGKPGASRLIVAVRQTNDLKMPPTGKLSLTEIAALEKWIDIGAPWPENITLAAPDAIAQAAAKHWAFQPIRRPSLPATSRHPIDALILARLETAKMTPSPVTDRRTLIRRATFDLHGLPPTPEEIEAFVKDPDPEAYPKLIDRLLGSPRYGERWGRHWLDVARYADNKGYVFFEGKEYPWAWTYRDYVIDALNRDLPFDRFVQEQIAADLLVPEDRKSQAALGFLTIGGHFMNNTHDIIDDRIDVVTRGLMGLTVTCARCHDHKFDPIPTADYYSLYGVFRGSVEPTVPPLRDAAPTSGDHLLYDAELKLREKALVDFVTTKHRGLVTDARSRPGEYLLAAQEARSRPPADDFMLLADRGDMNPTMITRWRQYLDDTRKRKDPVWLLWHAFSELPAEGFAERAAHVMKSVHGGNRLVREAFVTSPGSMKDVASRYGKLLVEIDKKSNGEPLGDSNEDALRRVLYGADSPADAPLALDWGFLSLFPDRATQGEYQNLLRALENWLAKGPPRAMVLNDAARPFEPRVFERGHPGRPGLTVPRQMPRIVNAYRKPFGAGSGRLELAREITSKENPLTARVFVNRVWAHHFGKSLTGTPGDFGLRADPPSHPELIDWLASEFITHGWSIKKLHKLIMTSATYMQSSLDRQEAMAIDPENRFFWKQNRQRLEFEPLHDSVLAVSGQLDLTLGGPSVRLFGGNRRRAVYSYVDRLEFPTLFTTFDVPHPAGLSPERLNTTVAPQALFLMNGPFTREAATKVIARQVALKLSETNDRLDQLFLTILGRRPTTDERKLSLTLVAKGSERWVDLAQGLMMTNEFAFVD